MGAVARDVIEIEHVRWRRRPADTDDDAREDARVLEPYLPQQDRRASFYLTVRRRFAIATAGALSCMAISTALAVPWSDELASLVGAPAAWLLITLIALVPGFLNTHLVLSLLLDRPRQLDEIDELPAVTVLIAAWNERGSLPDTIRAFSRLSYPGRCELLIVDDGSTDGTIDALHKVLDLLPRARLVAAEHGRDDPAVDLRLPPERT